MIEQKYKDAVVGINQNLFEDGELYYDYVFKLPSELQIIYTINILEQQVYNGGFYQYFSNGYGQFAFMTIKNLELIRAIAHKELLVKALKGVNSDNFNEKEFRGLIYNFKLKKIAESGDKLYNLLDDLDTQYYALEEDLRELYIDYLENKNSTTENR